MLEYSLERLDEQHDVSRFTSGNGGIDTYLKQRALKDQQEDLARTYVLLNSPPNSTSHIIGFFTLKAESYYISGGMTLPVVEFAYLARHIAWKGSDPRLGPQLLLLAYRITVRAADLIGISGMQLAPTKEGRRLYDEFKFAEHYYGQEWMFRSIADIRQLLQEYDA